MERFSVVCCWNPQAVSVIGRSLLVSLENSLTHDKSFEYVCLKDRVCSPKGTAVWLSAGCYSHPVTN